MLLKDKVAIITGAASARGLGFATAKLFADNGAKVVIIDLNGEASKTAAAALGEGHLGLAANVADEVQVQAAIEQILAKYGRVDVLVNNAGITQPLKLMDIKRANYDAVLDVSLRGTLLMSQAGNSHHAGAKIRQHRLHLFCFRPARRRYLRRPALQRGKSWGAWPGAGDGARTGPG